MDFKTNIKFFNLKSLFLFSSCLNYFCSFEAARVREVPDHLIVLLLQQSVRAPLQHTHLLLAVAATDKPLLRVPGCAGREGMFE